MCDGTRRNRLIASHEPPIARAECGKVPQVLRECFIRRSAVPLPAEHGDSFDAAQRPDGVEDDGCLVARMEVDARAKTPEAVDEEDVAKPVAELALVVVEA